LTDVQCSGPETNISQCDLPDWGMNAWDGPITDMCSHYEDVLIECDRCMDNFTWSVTAMHCVQPNSVEHSCSECPAGQHTKSDGLECLSCALGQYQNLPRQWRCHMCLSGQFRNASMTGESCPLCGQNHYQHLEGQSACIPCPAGRYTVGEDRTNRDQGLKCIRWPICPFNTTNETIVVKETCEILRTFHISRNQSISLIGASDGNVTIYSRGRGRIFIIDDLGSLRLVNVTLSSEVVDRTCDDLPIETVLSRTACNNGGIHVGRNALLTAVHVSFIKNQHTWGGAVFVESNSSVKLSHCHFSENYGYAGGSIYMNKMSMLDMVDCTFESNLLGKGFGFTVGVGLGVAICAKKNTMLLATSCRFRMHAGDLHKGTIYAEYSHAKFVDCDFELNTVYEGSGGIFETSNVSFVMCRFNSNGGYGWTGVLAGTFGGQTTIYKCVFTNNTETAINIDGLTASDGEVNIYASSFLGGRSFFDSTVHIKNAKASISSSLFDGNTAKEAGGVGLINSKASVITNCTFLRNKAERGY
jgi:hypothetical protein